jgi:hypothetical protein
MKNTWEIALLAVMLGMGGPAAGEAAQYFAPRYGLSANGQLQPPLTVEFQKGVPQKISASLTGAAGSEKVLVLGWQVGDGVGLCTLHKGVEYALYKLDFRPGKQDILVLSYGRRGTGKTHLNEVAVIGEDSLGVIRQLPVNGFVPTDVFNSPLQIRQQEAVLFLEQAPHVLALRADGENGYVAEVE